MSYSYTPFAIRRESLLAKFRVEQLQLCTGLSAGKLCKRNHCVTEEARANEHRNGPLQRLLKIPLQVHALLRTLDGAAAYERALIRSRTRCTLNRNLADKSKPP